MCRRELCSEDLSTLDVWGHVRAMDRRTRRFTVGQVSFALSNDRAELEALVAGVSMTLQLLKAQLAAEASAIFKDCSEWSVTSDDVGEAKATVETIDAVQISEWQESSRWELDYVEAMQKRAPSQLLDDIGRALTRQRELLNRLMTNLHAGRMDNVVSVESVRNAIARRLRAMWNELPREATDVPPPPFRHSLMVYIVSVSAGGGRRRRIELPAAHVNPFELFPMVIDQALEAISERARLFREAESRLCVMRA